MRQMAYLFRYPKREFPSMCTTVPVVVDVDDTGAPVRIYAVGPKFNDKRYAVRWLADEFGLAPSAEYTHPDLPQWWRTLPQRGC